MWELCTLLDLDLDLDPFHNDFYFDIHLYCRTGDKKIMAQLERRKMAKFESDV